MIQLRDMILEKHSKSQTEKIVQYIGDDHKRFGLLMKLLFSDDLKISPRAAWSIRYAAFRNPDLLKPYLENLVHEVGKPHVHPAVPRNILYLFQKIELPENLHGRLIDICFQFVLSHTTPVAIKAFALTILENFSALYPELKQELKLAIDERMPHETAAFKSRATKILRRMHLAN